MDISIRSTLVTQTLQDIFECGIVECSWVGGLLRKGWTKGYLEQSDLYNSPHSLYSETLHNKFQR